MALRLYTDSNANNVIDINNRDTTSTAVSSGDNVTDEVQIYIASDDTSKTYENISITQDSIASNWQSGVSYVDRDASTDTEADVVIGSDGNLYECIVEHTSDSTNEPVTGANYDTYWEQVKDVTVDYAEDSGGSAGTYADPLSLPDGDYATPVPIWRKAVINSITEADRRADIRHDVTFDEYVK